jgi:hypothetical protein
MTEHDDFDRDLSDAFRSVRDAYDGTNPDANVTLQRALFRTRGQAKRQRFTRWVVLPIAAVLVASTAWAGASGRLAPAVQSVIEAFHTEHEPRRVETPVAVTASVSAPPAVVTETLPAATNEMAPTLEPENITPKAAPPAVALRRDPPKPAPAEAPAELASPPSSAPEPPSTPAAAVSAPDPYAPLFAEAHRLHFSERDPARALAAWDRYLAAAGAGRFAPEAHYNRALALVRLGRPDEAKTELDAFARGAYGTYRRDEAKALLDALSRDASHP